MRYSYILVAVSTVLLLFSCKKEDKPAPVEPPVAPFKHVLLKDISIPRLPAPYYHFEYNTDSLVTKANFASGYTIYDVLYNGIMVSEMRNNIFVNHDTLRYVYDNTGKLTLIKFINTTNVVYRHAFFTYDGNLIKEIEWDHKQPDGSFFIDRTLSFSFYPDGNVKTITDHRPPTSGVPIIFP